MRHRKPDLIVPIHDRRRHRRVLTFRNTGYALLALLVAFLAITIRSEMRRGSAEGDYGRLYNRELPPPPPFEQKQFPVVEEESPIDDQLSADPMLTQPAARAQFLEADTTATIAPPPLTLDRAREGHARVAIVGGPEGVAAVDNAPRREGQKLKGGIFRAD